MMKYEYLKAKDFIKYPKLRHNLWSFSDQEPQKAFVSVSHGTFETNSEDASSFLEIRSLLTGNNTVSEIAQKSQRQLDEINNCINMLKEAGVLHLNIRPLNELSRNEIVSTLLSACELWSAQLAETHIATEICDGDCSRETFIGWLLETYHFVKNFSDCLKFAADFAKGETKELITHYYHEEISHESFILDTLVKCGVSKIEVESSIPLVSTLGLINHLKNMFEFEPLTVLLVAAIIESADVDESEIENFTLKVGNKYNLEFDALSSYFEHVRVDSKMEHGKLASKNQSLLSAIDLDKIHLIVNGLHDLKHFFDLQKLEIKSYYNQKGNYLPRQFVDFFAI